MLSADLFLALRYLKPKRTFVSVITLLSVAGPILGVAVLLIVMSIMNGFDRDIRQGIMDMQAHLQVTPSMARLIPEPEELCSQLMKKGVQGAAPLLEGAALMQLKNSVVPKMVKGINPTLEAKVSNLKNAILQGKYEIQDGEVLIGDRLALQLGLDIGDTILLHSPGRLTKNVVWKNDGSVEFKQNSEVYLPEKAKVAGIYSMGVADFDSNILFLTLDHAAELFGTPWGEASSIQCRVPDPLNMDDLTQKLRSDFPLFSLVTWKEQNSILFGTLRVEKNLMTFLLAFIVLVAAFSIAATLITVVVQKTREVGILKALGFSKGTIARIFLLQGTIIGVIGTTLGVGLGLFILAIREQLASFLSWVMGHDVFPAELYHLRQIPSYTSLQDLLFAVLLSLAVCILASVIPALYAASLHPVNALREE